MRPVSRSIGAPSMSKPDLSKPANPARILVLAAASDAARASGIEAAVSQAIPWSILERGELAHPTAGAAAVVVAGEHNTAVITGDQRVSLAATADPMLVAGVLVGELAAARAFDEIKAERRIESAVQTSAAKLIDEHQTETTLAVMVQRALLPPAPTDIPGVESSVLYRPCGSLSGDLYDIVRLDDHHLAFFLADACGHGVAAALLTMLIGRLLPMKDSTHHSYRIVPPGEALARLNAAYVERQPDSSRLITAIYGVLDLRSGQMTLASAGHPPAAVVGPRGTRLIGDSGPCLGMLPDAEFPQTIEVLAPGEAVLLYSDGFEWAFAGANSDIIGQVNPSDRRRPNDRYLQAFAEFGARLTNEHATAALDHMVATMDTQSGSLHQPDDVTLLAVCFRGPVTQAAAEPSASGEPPASSLGELRAKAA